MLHASCRELLCRLLGKVCQQMARNEVRDVGLIAPMHAQTFFERCGFGPDAYGSTGMLLSASSLLREDNGDAIEASSRMPDTVPVE
jgi:hypothetical protein